MILIFNSLTTKYIKTHTLYASQDSIYVKKSKVNLFSHLAPYFYGNFV